MNILADASLPGLQQAFPAPFHLTLYHHPNELETKLNGQDILLCRSTLKVNETLKGLQHLKYVATASSGTDHIDQHYLQKKHIEVVSAKGSNANSVADYVIANIAFLIDKKQLQLENKTVGIIGLGEVGTKVYERLKALNLRLLCFDPPKAERQFEFRSCSFASLFKCDILCIHAHLHSIAPYPSYNLINDAFFKRLRKKIIIINASRGGIVNETDLLEHPTKVDYCTDVYMDEPNVNPKIIQFASLCTPHIAGHSIEAKYNAVSMISSFFHKKLKLKAPLLNFPKNTSLHLKENQRNWEKVILSIYNPFPETQTLKNAVNLTDTFVQLRKKHHYRHDFKIYDPKNLKTNELLSYLLGKTS